MNPVMKRAGTGFVVIAWAAFAGCSGADHDALAARDASTGGSGGATIVEAGRPDGDAAQADAQDEDAGVQPDAPAPDSSFVPDGPSVFTLLNGIPNARAIRVCFEAETGDGFEPTGGEPLPTDPAGLAYGRSLSSDTVPGVDLEAQSVRPVVFSGELQLIDGESCEELQSPPAGVGRTELQVIPAGTLARGRSVLLVAAGCVDTSEPDPENAADVCGGDFTGPDGNATLLVASMERTPVGDAMGLQVFAGSVASGPLTVDQLTAFPAMSTVLVSKIETGEIAPRPPSDDLSVGDLGTSVEENTLRVFGDTASEPVVVVPLADALERGGLSIDSLEDGRNYTVVFYGPRPSLEAGSWFKAFSVTVVASDPS